MRGTRVTPRLTDGLLAGGLLVALAVELFALGPGIGAPPTDLATVAAAVVLSLAMVLRRSAPLAVVAFAAAALALLSSGPFDGLVAPLLGIMAATFSAGSETRGRAAIVGVIGTLVVVGIGIWRDAGSDQQASDVALPILLFGGAWLAGLAVRLFGERAAALDRARREEAIAAVAEERTRIARELHDSVAHAIAVVVVQARGARRVLGADPTAAREALDAIEATGSGALAEMRRLVGVLRAHDGAELAPPPGLGQLDELVARMREAGLSVEVEIAGPPIDLPPGLGLSAYRIVQEALTNALEHAPGATTRVAVRYRPDALELEISDTGRGPRGVVVDGHGLAGMRERAAMHDGALDAGPTADGGFSVRARLPLGETTA